MHETLQRLLEAQLRHELAQWRADTIDATIALQVRALFAWASQVTLNDAVTRQQIVGVIERFVIELRVSGGITELSGEMSRLVFRSRVTADTRVDEILSPASFEDFADKLTTLDALRNKLISLVAQSATFASINARMLVRSLLDLLAPRLPLGPARLALPLVQVAERLGQTIAPQFEQRIADLLTSYLEERREWMTHAIEKHLRSVLRPERLRSLLDEVWDALGPMRLAEAFAVMGEQDIEDFVILIFEFWQRYRKTDFFQRISSEMVDHFFRKYGEETLSSLIEDMGVSEAMVSTELMGFLRPVLANATASGALEHYLRQRLEAFYLSEAAAAALLT